jgi:small-conductance mechanosensitive channel
MKLDDVLHMLTQPFFKLGGNEVSLMTLVQIIASVVLVILLARLVRRVLRERVLARTKLDLGQQYAIARIAGYVVLALGLLIVLQTAGINLTSLAVVAGALGIGIGFGLQNIVNNFVSGLIILTERPIQIGNRVEVGGTAGEVIRIGARSTTIVTNDNIVLIIPNAEFVSGRVVNWDHGGDPRVRFRIPVGVSYGSEPRIVEKLLLEVADANEHVLKDPPPKVIFNEFGENSLNFELRAWSSDMAHRPGALKSELNFAIWEKLKANGIEIPFPQRDLHIKAPLQVELKQETRA